MTEDSRDKIHEATRRIQFIGP